MQRSIRFDGMSSYLTNLRRYGPLTREEEIRLSQAARQGDLRARERLATSNLALVIAVARRYVDPGGRLDDVVQEGNVGLLKAIDHYDPRKGTRFSTYAVWWIRAYIQRYLHDNRSQVRGGETQKLRSPDVSLDALEEMGPYADRLVDERSNPELDVQSTEHDRDVRAALLRVKRRLGELGWDILERRLTQDSPRTLEEIGKRWGVSRERVRQVELRTKAFLERYLEPLAA